MDLPTRRGRGLATIRPGIGMQSRLGIVAMLLRNTGETIDALRRLARGLHQSVLTEAGLSAALEALADEAPIPVTIDAPRDTRDLPSSEAAAWQLSHA